MTWLRLNAVFATVMLVLALAVLGEAGLLGERWSAARAARKRLDRTRRELRTLAASQPAPTAENAALIASELLRATQVLDELRDELAPTGETAERYFASAPTRRPEAFFDLAAFVEAMRSRAREAGVVLRPDERFGFASYAHEAPETGQLAAVFRERLAVQYLLEALLGAQPHQLLSVQRACPEEKPGGRATAKPEGRRGGGVNGGAAPDYFEIDPRISLRVPGRVETTAIRLSFTGQTRSLRALLTTLAESELPVVVRAVEVAPAERQPEEPVPGPRGVAPLVASAWSRFTVTVEFIALVAHPAAVS